ncbi:FecR domain-containing protein [Parerythrobacter aestuarii]|uniref:FecR domain-containing protein n=1 Tax=Parerythrobacter aestuarii TaxID=3020909 RepID=UPI0024DE1424|nr:FecR domain-containing protein [Parerythrobacter aestuarii]
MYKFATLQILLAACCACLFGAAPAHAQDDDFITYQVKKGDTLYGLGQEYLRGDAAAEQVRRINRVANPRLLPVARELKIPRDLLRFEDVQLRVAGFSGPVEVNGEAPALNRVLGEGQTVATGRAGFVSFRATNGAQVSLPSNTRARLMRARRYLLGDILDVDFAILSGRGEAVSPKLKAQGRMRMRTPTAVTSVRGTEFRVAHDEAAERSLTEVVEGEVAVAVGSESTPTGAGFGVASTASGVGTLEALLPAPAIEDPGAVQTGEMLVFNVAPLDRASAYRTQIARDAGFLEMVGEQVVANGPTEFASIDNGRYFVRARAISASGLEGLSETFSFRRKRLDVSAAVEESPLADGFLFKWLPEGEGETFFAFQMWRDGAPGRMLVDETGMQETGLILTDLEPGTYQWRVAAMQAVEEGLLKVWGPTQKLVVSE